MRRRLPICRLLNRGGKASLAPGAVLRRMRGVACFRGTAGDSCRSKEQCADRSAALNGAFARRAVNPARRPLYLPIGTYLVALEGRRGDLRDRGYMNDFHSRTTGKWWDFARDTDSVLPDAAAMSDAEAVVAASVLLGLAFLILT
jgi:hypothetical protein